MYMNDEASTCIVETTFVIVFEDKFYNSFSMFRLFTTYRGARVQLQHLTSRVTGACVFIIKGDLWDRGNSQLLVCSLDSLRY